jgi:hypothetical protein
MTHQPTLFTEPTPAGAGPVECLGLTFETDAARRAYFTEKLREKLQDPTIQGNLELLRPDERPLIQEFLTRRVLPDPLSPALIHAVQEVLSGLTKMVVKTDDLRQALLNGGSPMTLEEMKKRFETYTGDLAKGKDTSKLRIVLE